MARGGKNNYETYAAAISLIIENSYKPSLAVNIEIYKY
jgi:hypothetical protein